MNNRNKENKDHPLTQREILREKLIIRTKDRSIIMYGIIDDQNPGEYLIPFLDKVHENVLEHSIKALEIDISGLEYINSAGIKDLINWLLKFDAMESDRKYKITFVCDKLSRWQGLSVAMIQKIIPKNIYRKFI
ncbi:MAG: hypothetical protein JXJ04_01850 [Spirochaetales bacterium]|nr:hypothetical protein [Spirochaetales bacterium]